MTTASSPSKTWLTERSLQSSRSNITKTWPGSFQATHKIWHANWRGVGIEARSLVNIHLALRACFPVPALDLVPASALLAIHGLSRRLGTRRWALFLSLR